MKKLVLLAVIACCVATGSPNVLGMLGLGSRGFGMSKDDPLGAPEKLHQKLTTFGFTGNLGQIGKPRTMKFVSANGSDIKEEIEIVVGAEEYVQKIQGIYLNTQHLNSAQKNTPAGAFMSNLWSILFKGRPKFERKVAGQIKSPYMKSAGHPIAANITEMVAVQNEGDVQGEWRYSEDTMGEQMILKLK